MIYIKVHISSVTKRLKNSISKSVLKIRYLIKLRKLSKNQISLVYKQVFSWILLSLTPTKAKSVIICLFLCYLPYTNIKITWQINGGNT